MLKESSAPIEAYKSGTKTDLLRREMAGDHGDHKQNTVCVNKGVLPDSHQCGQGVLVELSDDGCTLKCAWLRCKWSCSCNSIEGRIRWTHYTAIHPATQGWGDSQRTFPVKTIASISMSHYQTFCNTPVILKVLSYDPTRPLQSYSPLEAPGAQGKVEGITSCRMFLCCVWGVSLQYDFLLPLLQYCISCLNISRCWWYNKNSSLRWISIMLIVLTVVNDEAKDFAGSGYGGMLVCWMSWLCSLKGHCRRVIPPLSAASMLQRLEYQWALTGQ